MIRVLVTPRDPNPYQELLYGRLASYDVEVRYLEGPTASRTINLLLKPAMLLLYHRRGCRVLHIHWVYEFTLPWAGNSKLARRLMQWWFSVFLGVARQAGYHIVWTAHNVVPHSQVFEDDIAGRRILVKHADAVIAHTEAAAAEVERITGARARVVPEGSYLGSYPCTLSRSEARSRLGITDDAFVVTFFGTVLPYKGVDDLLLAARSAGANLTDHCRLQVVVAGRCPDSSYARLLMDRASELPGTVVVLKHIPDPDVQVYLLAADVIALPFQRVTNSGSSLLALSFGRPLLIPALPALDDLPEGPAIRYEPGVVGLSKSLSALASSDRSDLERNGQLAREYASTRSWDTAAMSTLQIYERLTQSSFGPTRSGTESLAVTSRP